MKRLILALALPLMLVLLGCDGVSPTAPEVEIQADAVSATPTTTVGAAWTGSANAGVHEVPISGSETTLVDLAGPFLLCVGSPPPPNQVLFPGKIDGVGRFTHLGKTISVISATSCVINFSNGGLELLGEADHVSANGDVLHVVFAGTAFPDGRLVFDFVTFDGGTGRFENATGWADADGFSNAADGTGVFSFEGMISSVGSSK